MRIHGALLVTVALSFAAACSGGEGGGSSPGGSDASTSDGATSDGATSDAGDAGDDADAEAPVWVSSSNGLPANAYVTSIVDTGTSLLVSVQTAGSLQGGVWRSTDGGDSWTQVTGLPEGKSVYDLVVGPDKTLYAGTVGVWRSTDDGVTWTEMNAGFKQVPAPGIRALVLRDGKLWGASQATIYATEVATPNWALAATGFPTYAAVNALCAAPDGKLFAGINATSIDATGPESVFVSTDGASWAASGTGIADRSNVQAFAAAGDALFASAGSLYKSNDAGATWNKLPSSPATGSRAFAIDGGSLFAGTLIQGVFRSDDGGTTWARWGTGLPAGSGGRPVTALLLTPTAAFAGTDLKGLYRRPR